jgi:Family of unknown function (DUF6526)
MEQKPQTYANHVRYDPWFHFFLIPVAGLMVLGSIWAMITNPGLRSARYLLFSVWLLILAFKTRLYSLRQQDRIIRLEEKLRLAAVLPEDLRRRASELSDAQILALRFAPDAELPGLVQKTLSEKLAPKQIKQSITVWRPDYSRI